MINIDGVQIIEVNGTEQLDQYLDSFANAFQSVYSKSTYKEHFYPTEARSILQHHIKSPHQITLLAVQESEVVGFALACPVQSYPDIARQIRGLLPIKNTYYFAELGVLEGWRKKGIGRHLTERRLQMVDGTCYHHIVLRTSDNQDPAHHLYTTMGFEDMGVYMEISSRRIDGSIRTDRRLFLSRLVDKT
jgi:GNAT superfamily N-acetyltransferase